MAVDAAAIHGTRAAVTTGAASDSFDEVVLPHLGAALRLARWLMRNDDDAQDVVQEASLRAFRYFRTFSGGDGRAWFLRIVRNTSAGWRGRRCAALTDPFDEADHPSLPAVSDPETMLLQADDATLVARALRHVPAPFHQMLALREFEGLSYRELSDVLEIPIGTVMSRLSRARKALRCAVDTERTPAVSIRAARSCGKRRGRPQRTEGGVGVSTATEYPKRCPD